VIFGTRGGLHHFQAHAWLEGDPVESDYVELRRVAR
jgi:hypothetical protein